jgi:hypothetical protein
MKLEVVRQQGLIYGGLILIGLYMRLEGTQEPTS